MKKQKNKKRGHISKGTIKYNNNKLIIAAVSVILLVPCPLALYLGAYTLIAVLLILDLPVFISALFMFRFCIEYDIDERQIRYRKFFRFKKIDFDDIESISLKSKKKKELLIIKLHKRKVKINTNSCSEAKELKTLLKSRLPEKCEY